MRRQRSAKIVATLGPSSSTPEQIRALFEAGVDVFRLNFSHGTHQDHGARFDAIRRVETATGRPIGILADLQGPKLRLGTFAAGRIELASGAHFRLDLDRQIGSEQRAPLPHPEIFEALRPGTELLVDDGKVRLTATEVDQQRIVTRVEVGGKLSDRKGVSLPDTTVPFSALAPKDRSDLDAGAYGVIGALLTDWRPSSLSEPILYFGLDGGQHLRGLLPLQTKTVAAFTQHFSESCKGPNRDLIGSAGDHAVTRRYG